LAESRDFRADHSALRIVLRGLQRTGDRLNDRQHLTEVVEHIVQIGLNIGPRCSQRGCDFDLVTNL